MFYRKWERIILVMTVVIFAFSLIFNELTMAEKTEVMDDERITLAVENELLFDEGVSSHLIDVSTSDGIVTLSGSVDNLLAKERSLLIAESIRGVRAVINDITVQPASRTDEQIRRDIENALLFDPATESYEISVLVQNGVVTLKGTVDSWPEKQLAAAVAECIKGVREIQNNIVIHFEIQRPDVEIKRDVERRLENHVWVDDGLIGVQVDDGEVTITGIVGSLGEKRRAYSLAWVSGVRQVNDDELSVEWWARDRMRRESKYLIRSDEEIEKAVNDALLYDPRVFSFDVEPHVDNGVVTLTGTVNNFRAKKAAESDANNTIGVLRVVNRLKVRPVRMVPDEEIVTAAKDALRIDPIVERYEIDVDVINGKVHLNGWVDSKYEKMRAGDVVARQLGVVEVQNNLLIDDYWEPESDWAIRADIEREFRWDPFIDPNDITVNVVDGHVTLTGQVDTPLESKLAVENAFEGGARTVDNDLEVTFGHGLPQPGYHYEEPYWQDPWLHGGMGIYW